MRLTRTVAALVAMLLAATMSQALLSPVEAAAKPKHDLQAKGVELGGNTDRFAIRGKVSTYPSKRIKIYRSVAGGAYRVYKRPKTKSTGKFTVRVYMAGRKKTCFKVVVPATPVYRKTQKRIGCIVAV